MRRFRGDTLCSPVIRSTCGTIGALRNKLVSTIIAVHRQSCATPPSLHPDAIRSSVTTAWAIMREIAPLNPAQDENSSSWRGIPVWPVARVTLLIAKMVAQRTANRARKMRGKAAKFQEDALSVKLALHKISELTAC